MDRHTISDTEMVSFISCSRLGGISWNSVFQLMMRARESHTWSSFCRQSRWLAWQWIWARRPRQETITSEQYRTLSEDLCVYVCCLCMILSWHYFFFRSVHCLINKDHTFNIPVVAQLVFPYLRPSSHVIPLVQPPLSTPAAGMQGSVSLHNSHNIPIEFRWEVKDQNSLYITNLGGESSATYK